MKNTFKLAALGLVIASTIVACEPPKSKSTDKGIDTLNKVETKTIDTVSDKVKLKSIDTVSDKTLKTKSIDTVSDKVIETKTKKSESKVKVKKVVKE